MIYKADPKIWGTNWALFHIKLRKENYHPNYYEFSWYVPVHNGAFNTQTLNLFGSSWRVDWDNYDIEVSSMVNQIL